jgi:hypothetical protein
MASKLQYERSVSSSDSDRDFVFTESRSVLGTSGHHIQGMPAAHSFGVKRPGRESNHSPPPSAEVKNGRYYISIFSHVLMVLCLIKVRMCLHCMGRVVAQWLK